MNADTLVRHELVGLSIEVSDAPNPDLVGLTGHIVDETTNTLVLRKGEGPLGDADARERRIPKGGSTFVVTLEDGTCVRVAGERLVARPARRNERGGVSPWV